MFTQFQPLNFSQQNILSRFSHYIAQRDNVESENNRRFIESIGYCYGLTLVFLYSAWLETQPMQPDENKEKIARDDYTWFAETLTMIVTWDGRISSLSIEQKKQFERMIELVEFFQNTPSYTSLKPAFGEKCMLDTKGRVPRTEFTLAGLISKDDFTHSILDVLNKQKRCITIGSFDHVIGIFCIDNIYFFYNSSFENCIVTAFSVEHKQDLIDTIYYAMHYDLNTASPIGIRVFTFENNHEIYPSPQQMFTAMLDKTKAALNPINPMVTTPWDCYSFVENMSELIMAAMTDCSESLEFHLSQSADVSAVETRKGMTALHWAARNGNARSIKALLAANADVNALSYTLLTPLMFAIQENCYDSVKTLLIARASVNCIGECGTPLHIAAKLGNYDIIKMLLNYGADPLILDSEGAFPSQYTSDTASSQLLQKKMKQQMKNNCDVLDILDCHDPRPLLLDNNPATFFADGKKRKRNTTENNENIDTDVLPHKKIKLNPQQNLPSGASPLSPTSL